MNLRRLSAVPRFLGRVLSAVFGDFSWRAPGWLRGWGGHVGRHPRGWIGGVVILTALSFGGWQGWRWWEAHRPRVDVATVERKVSGKVEAPKRETMADGKPILDQLRLRFDAATAALDEVEADQAKGVTLQPPHPGEWQWATDKVLVFTPETDWPAGTDFEIKLDPAVLPKEVRLKEKSWEFTTPALEATVSNQEFYVDPADPAMQQVVVGWTFNYPVTKEEFEKHVKVEVLGQTPVFAWKGEAPKQLFTVVEGKHQRQYWVRTTRIQVGDREDFVKVSLGGELRSTNGGKSLEKAASAKVLVPDAKSGLRIKGMNTQIVRTDEGDPEQFLFIQTEGYATGAELAKHLEVWLLPKDRPAEGTEKAVPDFLWEATGAVTPAVLAAAVKVKTTHVEAEQPLTQVHAFKLLVEGEGTLYARVRAGLPGLGGFVLGSDAAHLVGVPEFPREVELMGKGALLALNGERKLSVMSRALTHLRYTLARVPAGQVNHLVTLTEGDFQAPQFRDSWVFNEENIGRIRREVTPVAMKNRWQATYSVFDFTPPMQAADPSDPDASRGLFFLTAEGVRPRGKDDAEADPDDEDDDPNWINLGDEARSRRFVLVTDLGLLVKQNADGSRDVFVQSIEKGGPVNGAQVYVIGKNGEYVAEAVTEDGHVHFANVAHLKREKKPVAILARLGNDVSFIPFERVDRALNFSRFDTAGVLASEKEALDAFLFTERGIYRPGDAVHIGAIIRRRDWQGTLAGLPVEMVVTDAREQEVDSVRLAVPQDGYLTWTCAMNEADPTGIYKVNLYVAPDGERDRIGRAVFRVEDFQPDRMKLGVKLKDADATAGWVQPEKVTADAHLETLFGFAAADRRIKAKMDLSPADFMFEAYPGFTFHNGLRQESKELAGKVIELGEIKTDNAGDAAFDLNLERFGQACFRMNLLVEAFEADGGRSVRGGASVLVAPFAYVVGYQGDGDLNYIGKDSARNVKLLAVDRALKPQAMEGLNYRVMQARHVSVLTKREDGNYAYVSTLREQVTAEGPLALVQNGTVFPLPTGAAGEFRLEVRNVENQIVCACPFSVVGKGDAERSLERNAELELKLARDHWISGEAIEMSVTAPFSGAGLITVEREKVLSWRWFSSATNSSVQQIPVPADLEGTAYVNVSYVRALDSPEVFMSPLSYAVQPFTANPDKRRLEVILDAPQLAKPGEVVHIGYRTAEAARIIVYAVDEGIHQITEYALPEPLPHFLRKRGLEVETEQLLDLILPEYSLLARASAFGGDEDKPPKLHLNPFKRRKEAPVVFWSGLLEAGPERREAAYPVPDYFAGRLKIMAVAVSAERMGQGETQSTVRGPFVLTPNVPTFAAPGDEVTVSLTVANNLEGQAASTGVTLGLTLSEHLELVEAPPNPLNVAPGKEMTTRFRLRALNQLGGAEMAFRAEGGGEVMERKATLSVRPAAPYMTEVESGYFRLPNHEVKTGRQMYPHFAKREATASVLPLGLARGLEAYLREYPHGCSEQITSRAMSRLLLADEVDFGFSRADAVQQMDVALSLLAQRQNGSGGFGYWHSASSEGVDFLSVYVTQLLVEARDAGFAVPERLLDGARRRMKEMAKVKIKSLDEAWVQAAAIYLLTRQGEVTTPYLLNLRDTLEASMKDAWKHHATGAFVAATYVLLKKEKEGADLMAEYRKAPREAAARWGGYYANDPQVRRALAFALLCRHFPEQASDLGYDDLAVITEPIQRGQFNTITSACTILALKHYSELAKRSGVKVAISELLPQAPEPRLVAVEGEGVRTGNVNAAATAVRFTLARPDGAPDLGAYYQVMSAGFDLKPPQEVVREGLEATRELLDAQGNPTGELKTGEGVTVRIRVRNLGREPRSDVAVLDLLPGGFEVEPENLRPGAGTLPGTDFVEVREDRNVFFLGLAAGETKTLSYRIKPVCAGRFAVPPVFAEAMYDRGIRGRSLGGALQVRSAE